MILLFALESFIWPLPVQEDFAELLDLCSWVFAFCDMHNNNPMWCKKSITKNINRSSMQKKKKLPHYKKKNYPTAKIKIISSSYLTRQNLLQRLQTPLVQEIENVTWTGQGQNRLRKFNYFLTKSNIYNFALENNHVKNDRLRRTDSRTGQRPAKLYDFVKELNFILTDFCWPLSRSTIVMLHMSEIFFTRPTACPSGVSAGHTRTGQRPAK